MGIPFIQALPLTGTVSRQLALNFLLSRLAEKATGSVIKSEFMLWQEILTDIGEAQLPHAYINLKLNRLVGKKKARATRVKTPLA